MRLSSRRGLQIVAGRMTAGVSARTELALLEALMLAAMAALAVASLT